VVATIEEVRRLPIPTAEKIERLFEQTARRARSAPPLRRSLVVDVIGMLHGDPRESELGEALRRSVASLLRDGVRAGDVTRAHPVPVLARVIAGSFYALMLDWASIDGFPLRARSRTVARFLADALTSRSCGSRSRTAQHARPVHRRDCARSDRRRSAPRS
jgi:hypothetical protein